jgi:uncharacterized protein
MTWPGAIIKCLPYRHMASQLYYWRTKSGVEVDFVVYGEDTFTAIEVKNTGTIRPADLKSLRRFHQDYPEAKTILIYRGHEQLQTDHIQCLPCDAFLQQIHPESELTQPAGVT